jgi:hypothetical protein
VRGFGGDGARRRCTPNASGAAPCDLVLLADARLNSEVRWLDNLLYLYTKPFDIVVDTFASGETVS